MTDDQASATCDALQRAIDWAKKDPACMARAAALRRKQTNRSAAPWIGACIDHWKKTIDESDLGVDWADAGSRCWRCGSERTLQKCHIVAKQFGGDDGCENTLPMCSECHDEAPDVCDAGEVWRWIKETRPQFYGTLKAERAARSAAISGADLSSFDHSAFEAAMDRVGLHLMQNGSGCRVKESSVAWAIKAACRQGVSQ